MISDPEKKSKSIANPADIDNFLKKVEAASKSPSSNQHGRLLFALDATASREPTWDQACEIQSQMFSAVGAMGSLKVQLVYYKGFGEFVSSTWLTDSNQLIDQMIQVRCLGGQTQINKVFRHALKVGNKTGLSAVVFIGDCIEEDVDELCVLAGDLAIMGIPVFIFQEGNDYIASLAFKQITKLTGGAHCTFDLSSAEQLGNLLSAVAVFATGGRKALEVYGRGKGEDVFKLLQQVK